MSNTPTTGYGYLLYVNSNSEATQALGLATFQLIGGQTNLGEDLKLGNAKSTTKDSNNWEEHVLTNKSWSISTDALIELDDLGYAELMEMWNNRQQRLVKLEYPDGSAYYGKAGLTQLSKKAPQDGVATITISFEGTGAWSPVAA